MEVDVPDDFLENEGAGASESKLWTGIAAWLAEDSTTLSGTTCCPLLWRVIIGMSLQWTAEV